MKAKFKIGDKVQLISEPSSIGVIADGPFNIRDTMHYRIFFGGNKGDMNFPENVLESHEEIQKFAKAFENEEFLDRLTFLFHLICEKIRTPLSDNLYTFYASRTDFQVHQFKPVLKLLDSVDQRLFIADEVGLGKTIEASIILTELQARHQGLSRVLIVCPAALLQKWEEELRRRFNEIFSVQNSSEFKVFLDRYENNGDNEKLKAIVSLQTLRDRRMLERLQELQVSFDLVIIDESHHMKNPTTNSSLLGEILSENADALIMMSATPLHLGTEDLFNQLHILAPGEFRDLYFFNSFIEPNEYINAAIRSLQYPQEAAKLLQRVEGTSQNKRFQNNSVYSHCLNVLKSKTELTTNEAIEIQRHLVELNTLSNIFSRTRRKDVSTEINFPERQAKVINVEFTEEESELYEAVTEWVIQRYQHSNIGIGLAKIMPQRQVSSCIPAMKGYFEKILTSGKILAPRIDNGDYIDFSEDTNDDKLEESERVTVCQLLEKAKRVDGQDSKFNAFISALRLLLENNPFAKVIVFSFFKRTLEYLHFKLTNEGISNVLIHGDVKLRDRQKRVRKFWSDSTLTVLLSSEVGGEGLDLQIANVIFNYDLPWNPMRVEQRIGRVDRYGQLNEKIFIYNFSINGTIDDIILKRLYERIKVFERYIGDIEQILGSKINKLIHELFECRLTKEERQNKVDKVGENILREKQELEKFERESERFIGQDEYFVREISNIRDTRRFITADEVQFLLENFIKIYDKKSTLKPTKSGRNEVYILKASKEFQRLVYACAPDEHSKNEIVRKLSNEHGIQLTFDSKEACKDDNLIFITIHSPIIKGIVEYITKNQEKTLLPVSKIELKSYNGLKGNYFLFVYLLELNGIKKQLKLVPILVNIDDTNKFHYQDNVTEFILGKIVDGADLRKEIHLTVNQINSSEIVANEWITLIREEQEEKLERSNQILLNNRIESIKQALDIKQTRISKIIDDLSQSDQVNKNILRLHQGRMKNLQESAEDEIDKWESKRKVSVGYRPIIGCLIRFD